MKCVNSSTPCANRLECAVPHQIVQCSCLRRLEQAEMRRDFRSRNNEMHDAIWKVNELFACLTLSLDETDISGLYQTFLVRSPSFVVAELGPGSGAPFFFVTWTGCPILQSLFSPTRSGRNRSWQIVPAATTLPGTYYNFRHDSGVQRPSRWNSMNFSILADSACLAESVCVLK
jgi:hypothetical protein